jgi:hypothetical protein
LCQNFRDMRDGVPDLMLEKDGADGLRGEFGIDAGAGFGGRHGHGHKATGLEPGPVRLDLSSLRPELR